MLQDFVTALRKTIRDEISNIHTALTGEIVSYDPAAGTAVVQPCGTMSANGQTLGYPLLHGLPVLFPQGYNQSTSIVFPVSRGDPCLVVLSECPIDTLMHRQDTGADLRFDLTNAICIPGLFATAPKDASEACNEKAVIIRSGDTRLKVGGSGVSITGDLHVSGQITS